MSCTKTQTRRDEIRQSLNKTDMTINDATVLHSKLNATFAKHGITTTLVADDTLQDAASITKDGENATLTYNPRKAGEESIFHEFGHLYVELASDPSFIQKGVEQVRGTALWERVEKLYPEYNDSQLGLEVLTTAIGIEADKGSNSPLAFWLNRLLIRVADALGITVDVAKRLASDLVAGNLTKKIDGTIAMEEQHQRDGVFSKELDIVEKFLEDKIKPLKRLTNTTKSSIRRQRFATETTEISDMLTGHIGGNNKHAALTQLEAVTALTKYDMDWLGETETRLRNLTTKYENNKNLIDLTKEELTDLGTTLEHIDQFLDGFVHIDNLTDFSPQIMDLLLDSRSIGTDELGVIKTYRAKEDLQGEQKQVAETIAMISNVRNGLSVRVNQAKSRNAILRTYFRAGVTAKSADKEIARKAMNMHTDMFTDENFMQYLFMNNLDSTNAFVANVGVINETYAKQYKHRQTVMIAELEEVLEQTKGVDIKKLYTNIDGTQGTILAGKYDYVGFKADLKEAQRNAKTPAAKRTILNQMTNTLTQTEIDDLLKEYEQKVIDGEITQDAYDRWERDNFFYDTRRKLFDTRLFGDYRNPIDEKYEGTRYAEIHADPNSKEAILYDYILKTQKSLLAHTGFSIQYYGGIPIIDTKITEKRDAETGLLVDEKGNLIRSLRLRNVGNVTKRYIYVPEYDPTLQTEEEYEKVTLDKINLLNNSFFKSIEEVDDYNEKLKEENAELLKKAVSYDLSVVMPKFIESSLEHQMASKIEHFNLSASQTLKETSIVRKDNAGNFIVNFASRNKEGGLDNSTLSGEQSNVSKRFDKDMDMKLYGNFIKDNKTNRALQEIRNYTALIGLGFNVHAAAKNLAMGEIQMRLEAKAGIHFNDDDLKDGKNLYKGARVALLNGGSKTENYAAAIMNYHNVIDDYSELIDQAHDLDVVREGHTEFKKKKNEVKRLWNKTAFGLTTMTEHGLHNKPLLAMMHSHRIIDGKIVSRWDFVNNAEKFDMTQLKDKAYVADYIARKKEHKETAEELFENSGIRLIDAFDHVNGVASISKDENGVPLVSEDDYSRFEIKVQGVNHKLHGIYNKSDKGIIENTMVGQLAMQYRHWLPAMWQERFGATGNPFSVEATYNERRQEKSIGNYNAVWKMVGKATSARVQTARELDGSVEPIAAIQAFVGGAFDFLANAKVYYHTMEPYEQAALMKAVNELGFAVALTLAAMGLAAIPDDDELGYVPKALKNLLIKTLKGTTKELAGLAPLPSLEHGWIDTGYGIKQSPVAAWGSITNGLTLISRAVAYPGNADGRYYQSGPNKGELKLYISGLKMVPFFSQLERWMKLDDESQRKTYSAFG